MVGVVMVPYILESFIFLIRPIWETITTPTMRFFPCKYRENEALEHYLAHLTWPENAAPPCKALNLPNIPNVPD
jgi:hypothetical protein